MARVTQKLLENRLEYIAGMVKIRYGPMLFNGLNAKYPYKDTCLHFVGANGRHAVELTDRKGHVWNSLWLTRSEMETYLEGMVGFAKVTDLKKGKLN